MLDICLTAYKITVYLDDNEKIKPQQLLIVAYIQKD